MRNERGVTLIIVVIELLVLAVITTIIVGSGKDMEKPVKMATTTKSENRVAKDKEQIAIAFSEFAGMDDYTPDDLKAKLEEVNKGSVIEVTLIRDGDYSIIIDGRKYEVDIKNGGNPIAVE